MGFGKGGSYPFICVLFHNYSNSPCIIWINHYKNGISISVSCSAKLNKICRTENDIL